MPRFPAAPALLTVGVPALALFLVACSPTFDWREVPVGTTGLRATFPCKPQVAERSVPIAPGREVVMQATGCEAGGVAFAVLAADVKEPALIGSTLAQWRQASLAAQHGQGAGDAPFLPKGALAIPESVQVRSQGTRSDGSAVTSRTAYFARGTVVYQAAVHAARANPDAADTFFAGLKFE